MLQRTHVATSIHGSGSLTDWVAQKVQIKAVMDANKSENLIYVINTSKRT